MNEPLHDIDKFFYHNIEGHSEYPPKKVWDKVEAGLDKDTAVIYKKKYKIVKRAAVILLLLFLGVLLYEIVGRHPGKENVAGANKKNEHPGNGTTQQNDNLSNPVEKDNAVAEPGKNDTLLLQDQRDNPISRESKLQDNQSPVVLPAEANKANGTKKDLANNTPAQGKEDHATLRQKAPSSQMGNHVAFEVKSAGNGDKRKVHNNTTSSLIGETVNNDPTKTIGLAKRDLPLLIPAGSRQKDIMAIWNPSFEIPENGSASILAKLIYPSINKSANPAFRNYGLSLSLYFSPNATWNSIEDDKPYRPGSGSGSGPVDHDEIKRSEHNSFAYSGGVKLGYGLSKKISIKTGINYTKSSTKVRPKDIYAERDNYGNILYRFDCSSGYTYILPHSGTTPSPGDTITVTNNHNSLSYLGIPLEVEYRMSFGKFSLSAAAGGQVNILLEGKTTAVLGKGTSDETSASSKTQGLRSSYFSAITSLTGELQLNKKLSLTVAPTGQFGLSPINNGASVKTRPNYAGLAAGVKLKL